MDKESIASYSTYSLSGRCTCTGNVIYYETKPVRAERLSKRLDTDGGSGVWCGNPNGDWWVCKVGLIDHILSPAALTSVSPGEESLRFPKKVLAKGLIRVRLLLFEADSGSGCITHLLYQLLQYGEPKLILHQPPGGCFIYWIQTSVMESFHHCDVICNKSIRVRFRRGIVAKEAESAFRTTWFPASGFL